LYHRGVPHAFNLRSDTMAGGNCGRRAKRRRVQAGGRADTRGVLGEPNEDSLLSTAPLRDTRLLLVPSAFSIRGRCLSGPLSCHPCSSGAVCQDNRDSLSGLDRLRCAEYLTLEDGLSMGGDVASVRRDARRECDLLGDIAAGWCTVSKPYSTMPNPFAAAPI